jgi:DnaJ-class molecular chaperone
MARPDGTTGDLILTINVTVPTTLTDHQRELLSQARG